MIAEMDKVLDLRELGEEHPVLDAMEKHDREMGIPGREVSRNRARRAKTLVVESGEYSLPQILANTLERIQSRNGKGDSKEIEDLANFYIAVRPSISRDERSKLDAILKLPGVDAILETPGVGVEPPSKILKWARKHRFLDEEGHLLPISFKPLNKGGNTTGFKRKEGVTIVPASLAPTRRM